MTVTTAQFSVEDYHQMIEAGILACRRVELIDRRIIEMPPEGTEHSYYGQSLADFLRTVLSQRALVRENKPITLSDSEPEPDIAIVKLPPSLYLVHHPYPQDIYLLVEVSKATIAFDKSKKKKIYAAAGIQEYWIVDVKGKQLITYRFPLKGDYQSVNTLLPGTSISPLAFPDIEIAVSQIFAH